MTLHKGELERETRLLPKVKRTKAELGSGARVSLILQEQNTAAERRAGRGEVSWPSCQGKHPLFRGEGAEGGAANYENSQRWESLLEEHRGLEGDPGERLVGHNAGAAARELDSTGNTGSTAMGRRGSKGAKGSWP